MGNLILCAVLVQRKNYFSALGGRNYSFSKFKFLYKNHKSLTSADLLTRHNLNAGQIIAHIVFT